MQSGTAHMLILTEDLDWRSGLDHANRAFAAILGGQRYENITREEAKRICPPEPVREAVSVEKNAGLLETATKAKEQPAVAAGHLAR